MRNSGTQHYATIYLIYYDHIPQYTTLCKDLITRARSVLTTKLRVHICRFLPGADGLLRHSFWLPDPERVKLRAQDLGF